MTVHKHEHRIYTLTSCSEHITNSVHLPSHLPILEGSGRDLEPRRLRGKDGSPVRSRLPDLLGSHHSRMNRPAQGRRRRLLLLLLKRWSGASTHSVRSILVAGFIDKSREVFRKKRKRGGGVHFTPACCGPTNTDNRITSATPSRKGTDKGTKKEGKLS